MFTSLAKDFVRTFDDKNSNNLNTFSKLLIKFKFSAEKFYNNLNSEFNLILNKLYKLNPTEALKLGYAVIKKQNQIKSVDEVNIGDEIIVKMIDGEIGATVTKKEK